MKDERRSLHRRQDVANVGLRVHDDEVPRRGRARGGTGTRHPPSGERLVGARRHSTEVGLDAPFAFDSYGVAGSLLCGLAPRVVGLGPSALRVGPVQGERPDALRVRRREQRRQRPTLRVAEERRALAADGVHDRAHVVHPRLEVGQSDGTVGEAGPALVEADQPGEGAKPLEQPRRRRVEPVGVEMRDESRDEHEVERPSAGHLVGDVHITALRIPDRCLHGLKSRSPRFTYSLSSLSGSDAPVCPRAWRSQRVAFRIAAPTTRRLTKKSARRRAAASPSAP